MYLTSFLLFLLTLVSAGLFFALAVNRRWRHEHDALIHQNEVIFGFIHDVGEVFARSDELDLDRMLNRVLFYALRTTGAGAGAIYLEDAEGSDGPLRARAISGLFPPLSATADVGMKRVISKARHMELLVRSENFSLGQGLVGECADFGTPILIEDAARDPRVPEHALDFMKIHSILLVPMRFLQRVLGVMVVINPVDAKPFSATDMNLLQALADQASVTIHYAGLRDALDEKKRIDHDLAVARQIQRALLPKAIPHVEGLEIAAYTHPAQEIGGDYYDIIRIDDNHIGIAIADVSGKGIVGAIMMSISRSVLRAQAAMNTRPSEVLRAVNRVMHDDIAEDMFVSMLYMVINISERTLTVARAGHERPLLHRFGGTAFEIIDSPGVALGMADQADFDEALKDVTVTLQPGDVLVAYTDGVTEAMDAQGEEWGLDRFFESVGTGAPDGAHAVLNNVQQRMLRFTGDMDPYDDITLLATRFVP